MIATIRTDSLYGILINRPMKRITVIFRGTYADGTDDWRRNMQFDQVEIPVPHNLQPLLRTKADAGTVGEKEDTMGDDLNSPTDSDSDSSSSSSSSDRTPLSVPTMRFHQGLHEYLFENSSRDPKYQDQRYEEILRHLHCIIRDNPDFKIYVAGHSLGGALAKLFGLYLSTSRQALHIPKPITCVCIGSQLMGDTGFQRPFHCVERLGWIRHLRITNDGDPVCYLPPLVEYQPSGMHLRLRRRCGHIVWHPSGLGMTQDSNTRNGNSAAWSGLMGVLRSSITQGGDLFNQHMVPAYLERLELERDALQKLTLDDLYRNPDLMGTDSYFYQF
jgi:hypothetical protein